MRLRLAKASGGTHWTQKKIPRLMVAFAMVAGTITAVFLGTAQPASAAVDDYKPAHWNMQGSQNEQDSKWQSGVRRLLNDGHNVIALQEAGQPPASAGYLDPDTDRIVPGEAAYTYAPRSFTFTRTRRDGTTYTQTQSYEVRRYDWRPNGNGHDLSRSWFEEVQGDGAGDEAGSWVFGAAGLVAQAGAFGLDRGGAVGAVADDPAGEVGDEELQGLAEVFRGKKPSRRSR